MHGQPMTLRAKPRASRVGFSLVLNTGLTILIKVTHQPQQRQFLKGLKRQHLISFTVRDNEDELGFFLKK